MRLPLVTEKRMQGSQFQQYRSSALENMKVSAVCLNNKTVSNKAKQNETRGL